MPESAPVGWPYGNYVVEPEADVVIEGQTGKPNFFSVVRELVTDVPDQVRGAIGVSSAVAAIDWMPTDTVVEPGHWQPWEGRVVTRYDTGRDVTIDMGYNGLRVPVFRGRVIDAVGGTSSGSMSFDCIDALSGSNFLSPASLPALAHRMPIEGGTDYVECGVTPSWAIHKLTAAAGYFSIPQRLSGAMLDVPLQGSLWPDLGRLTEGADDTQWAGTYWTPKEIRWPDGTDEEVPGSRLTGWAGDGSTVKYSLAGKGTYGYVRVAFHYSGEGDVTITLNNRDFAGSDVISHVRVNENRIYVKRGSNPELSIIWPGFGPVEISIRTTSILTVGGATLAAFTAWWDGGSGDYQVSGSVSVGTPADIDVTVEEGAVLAALQVGSTATGNTPLGYASFSPTADLDNSLGEIDGTPGIYFDSNTDKSSSDLTIRDVLYDISEAELGVYFIAEDGTPTFRNRNTLRGLGVTPVPVTSRDDIKGYDWQESDKATYGYVEVPYAPVTIRESTGGVPDIDVWSLDTKTQIMPRGQIETVIDATLTGVPIGLDSVVKFDANASMAIGSVYRSENIGDHVARALPAPVVEMTSPRTARITIRSFAATGGTYELMDLSGDPYLKLRAQMSIDQPDDSSAALKIVSRANTFREDTFRMPASTWRQKPLSASKMARFLAGELRRPTPVLRSISIVPNLLLKLCDIVQVQHPDTGMDIKGVVTGYNKTFAGDRLVGMSITVRAVPITYGEVLDAINGGTYQDDQDARDGLTYDEVQDNPLGGL